MRIFLSWVGSLALTGCFIDTSAETQEYADLDVAGCFEAVSADIDGDGAVDTTGSIAWNQDGQQVQYEWDGPEGSIFEAQTLDDSGCILEKEYLETVTEDETSAWYMFDTVCDEHGQYTWRHYIYDNDGPNPTSQGSGEYWTSYSNTYDADGQPVEIDMEHFLTEDLSEVVATGAVLYTWEDGRVVAWEVWYEDELYQTGTLEWHPDHDVVTYQETDEDADGEMDVFFWAEIDDRGNVLRAVLDDDYNRDHYVVEQTWSETARQMSWWGLDEDADGSVDTQQSWEFDGTDWPWTATVAYDEEGDGDYEGSGTLSYSCAGR
ncbi:MAG: hypothetical protein QGG40_13955 [Myxococcota bacterium]|nr:hypothetical protein [Myxococcota bacterium]